MSITLHQFNETHYKPVLAKRRPSRPKTKPQFDKNWASTQAIKRFDKYLGRESTLADLTDENLLGLHRAIMEAGESFLHQGELLSLWRFAAKLGAVEPPTVSFSKAVRVPSAAKDEPDPRRIGLQQYLTLVYLPERAGELSESTLKSYRQAIRHYVKFSMEGECLHCDQISATTIRAFRSWQVETGINPKKAANHATVIATIAKHACPEKWFPKGGDSTPDVQGGEHRLEAILRDEYIPVNTKIASEKTTGKYLATIFSFGRYLGHAPTLEDLTDANLGGYMRHLKDKGLAIHTVNGYRSKILALWNWCAKKRLVDQFPTVQQFAKPQQIPSAWTQADLRKLLAACSTMVGDYAGVPAALWWRAIHLVSWDSGERTGALLDLRWNWLDRVEGHLVVPAEYRKGGRKAMHYTLKPDTLKLLLAIAMPQREQVFPFPWERSMFFYRYRRLLKAAGLPYVKYKSGLQKMRRSFASHLEAGGGNATTALRHSSRDITEDSYIDPTITKPEPANVKLFKLT